MRTAIAKDTLFDVLRDLTRPWKGGLGEMKYLSLENVAVCSFELCQAGTKGACVSCLRGAGTASTAAGVSRSNRRDSRRDGIFGCVDKGTTPTLLRRRRVYDAR